MRSLHMQAIRLSNVIQHTGRILYGVPVDTVVKLGGGVSDECSTIAVVPPVVVVPKLDSMVCELCIHFQP